MGKWNKAPPEVSEEFMQNQQRRKQMIVQAAKRRRQKQKKMQDQAEIQRKNQEDALVKHKQDKKDAYIKYLRNNMHDKYENMKHNEKINQPEIRSKSKWKKDTIQSESKLKNQSNLQSLNLQVNIQNKRRNIQNRTYAKPGGQVVRNQPVVQNLTKQPSSYTNQYNVGNRNLKDVHLDKLQSNYQPKQTEKRRMLENQFQNLWKQENQVPQKQIEYELSMGESVFDDLIGSRLLDSLDLDLDTVSRGKRLDKKIKNQNYNFKKDQHKQINEIKNLIGYQSILMSVDQRSEMIKKYSEFMTNQVQPPRKTEQINTKDVSKQKNHKNPRSTKQSKPQPISKPLNQGQVFNQLKNKKEGKILNWANQQVEQADDLFSNCSTSKKSKTRGFQMLKDINKQIQAQGKKTSQPPAPSSIPSNQLIDMKKKQRPLQTIPQKKINVSRERLRQRSYEKKNPIQQVNIPQNNNQNRSHEIKRSVSKQKIVEVRKSRTNRLNSAQNNASNQVRKNIRQNSKERVNKTATNSFKQNRITSGQNNMTQPRDRNERGRSLSRDQPNSVSSKEVPVYTATGGYSKAIQARKQVPATNPQSINPFANKLAHLPPRPYQNMDQVTVATQDQLFQIQSFIKNELLTLNKQERQVQQQLKNIHVQNKDKIKDIQKKYEIRTDYKHSRQLKVKGEDGSDQIDEEIESNPASYKQLYKKQTQDQLQDSIQRLDDMLLRREITQKQRDSRVKEESNMSQATSRSIINPMCDPITLHKQVLQLAQNLSRFEGQPDNIQTGYGAKLRMQKRSASKQKKPEQKVKQSSRMKQNQIDLSQSQDVNYSELNSNQKQSKVSKVSRPPQLDYIQQNYFMPPSHNLSDLLDDQLQDSIEKGKIEVNQRLKRMLLD